MPTRGRIRNTMYVITRSAPADADTGEVNDIPARRGTAVLADILTEDHGREADQNLSALAQHEHESEVAKSTQVSLERLAVEIAEATAGRTSTLLDRLTATGALPARHRKALAADEAHGSLERLLRTVEVAGHDPATVLKNAVAERSLDEALHPARVLHRRITAQLDGQLTPQVTTYADLIPPGVPEAARARLEKLADDADTRRHELGERAATEAPQWVIEALGPVPDDTMTRADWEQRAGWAAAYRELSGHEDETNPLGTPPPAGLAENFAAWRVAHTALDLPDSRPEEAQLPDGRLRSWVRAMDRETQWAPRYVADELAVTHRQADKAHEDATVWAARAEVATDDTERELLRAEAALGRGRPGRRGSNRGRTRRRPAALTPLRRRPGLRAGGLKWPPTSPREPAAR